VDKSVDKQPKLTMEDTMYPHPDGCAKEAINKVHFLRKLSPAELLCKQFDAHAGSDLPDEEKRQMLSSVAFQLAVLGVQAFQNGDQKTFLEVESRAKQCRIDHSTPLAVYAANTLINNLEQLRLAA